GIPNHPASAALTAAPPRTVKRQFGTVASSSASPQKTSVVAIDAASTAAVKRSIGLVVTRPMCQPAVAAALQAGLQGNCKGDDAYWPGYPLTAGREVAPWHSAKSSCGRAHVARSSW